MARRFIQCDVFASVPTKGNALAVVVDAEGLSDEAMQAFARWTNLAETTFLLPPDDPDADYKLRIFTPTREMLFAGHPTLGSCMAWLESGGTPKASGRAVQECGVGLVEIDLTGSDPAFAAPPTAVEPMVETEKSRIMARLGLEEGQVLRCAQLTNGPVWQAFELDGAESVLALDATLVRWPEYKALGFFGRRPVGADTDLEARMLAPSSGMSEDPITGSLNAALACWLRDQGRLDGPLSVAQGRLVGREGRVSIRPRADGRILIGGAVRMVIRGEVEI